MLNVNRAAIENVNSVNYGALPSIRKLSKLKHLSRHWLTEQEEMQLTTGLYLKRGNNYPNASGRDL